MATVIFSDNTKLEDLVYDGNLFFCGNQIDFHSISKKLSPVTIDYNVWEPGVYGWTESPIEETV